MWWLASSALRSRRYTWRARKSKLSSMIRAHGRLAEADPLDSFLYRLNLMCGTREDDVGEAKGGTEIYLDSRLERA